MSTLLLHQRQTGVIPKGKKNKSGPYILYRQTKYNLPARDRNLCNVKTDLDILDGTLQVTIIVYDGLQTGGILVFISQFLKVNKYT